MCGIAGFTHRGKVAGEGIARRVAASLFHRGPDQQGIFESTDISLCAVRLKIIDLEGGDQPIVSDDGDTAIAFNGEVYNHAELRRELEALGHRFHTHCDTEVVLHAFQEWDTACLGRLRGMFAIALWSESRRRLVLARDRVGIKPLYYYRGQDGGDEDVYFGSELKAILEHAGIPRVLDMDALEHYLCLNYVPCPQTLVQGIRKLPPGHFLEWQDGGVRIEPWWRLEFHPRDWSLADAKDELDHLLRESVREHLVSDVPLGIWASGGLDSSAILHYAAETCPRRLSTFSVSFAGRSFDESRYFREIARLYGTEHHEFDLNPGLELAGAIEDLAWYSDEPGADAGALPVWFLSRMSREHVTVALSGEGADELFGGYLTYVADHLTRSLRLLPVSARRLLLEATRKYWPVSDDKISLEYMLKRGLEGSCLHPDEAHFFWNGTFTPAQRRRLCPSSNGHNVRQLLCGLPEARGIGFVNRFLLADQQYYLPDDILYKCDRMSMAHALEVRPPFLDHRIVEFAASLPQNFKLRGWTTKFLLKELMRGKLPSFVIDRKKTGFDIPTHDWFRTILRDLLLDTLSPEAVAASGIFDARAIQELISDHMDRRINAGYHIWGLLTLFLWMKRWKIESPAAAASPIPAWATS